MNELTTLETLADKIKESHAKATNAASKAVAYATEAGSLLIQAKAQLRSLGMGNGRQKGLRPGY